jgi:RAC serine/threonine-protein kinase
MKSFSEDRTRFYGAEIISAIGYLHEHGNNIYGDLKVI